MTWPAFCQVIVIGLLFLTTDLVSTWSQIPSHEDKFQRTSEIAALENQIRLSFMRNDAGSLNKSLEALNGIAPDNGIYQLYAQMMEQRKKGTKPSRYRALRPPYDQPSSQTLAAANMPEIAESPQHSISIVEPKIAVEPPATTPTVIALSPEQQIPEPPASTEAVTDVPATQTNQPAETTPQVMPAAAASPSPMMPAAPVASPAISGVSAVASSIAQAQQTKPVAARTDLLKISVSETDEAQENLPIFERLKNRKTYWAAALAATFVVIGSSLLVGRSRRQRVAAEESFAEEKASNPAENAEQAPPPEIHLSDILVKMDKSEDQTPEPDYEHALDETQPIIDSSEELLPILSGEPEENLDKDSYSETATANKTFFGNSEQTLPLNPDLDDLIKIKEDQFASDETVASFDFAPKINLPADSADAQLDWKAITEDTSKSLSDKQRQTIFDESYQKGCDAFEKQDYRAAFQHFSVALSLKPENPEVSTRLAMVRKALKK